MELTVSTPRSTQTTSASSTSLTVKVITPQCRAGSSLFTGDRDLLKMLYHHHEEEAGPGQTFIPEVYSRLPSVGILSEDTEAEVGEGGEVNSRDSWNLASPLPPHLEVSDDDNDNDDDDELLPGGAALRRDHRVRLPQGGAL